MKIFETIGQTIQKIKPGYNVLSLNQEDMIHAFAFENVVILAQIYSAKKK